MSEDESTATERDEGGATAHDGKDADLEIRGEALDPVTTPRSVAADAAVAASLEMTELSAGALSREQIDAAVDGISLMLPEIALPKKPEIVVAQDLRVRESSQGPTAKRARFTCDACKGTAYIEIPWNATALERSSLMKEAVDEHRFLCPVGLVEDTRIYRIHYPR